MGLLLERGVCEVARCVASLDLATWRRHPSSTCFCRPPLASSGRCCLRTRVFMPYSASAATMQENGEDTPAVIMSTYQGWTNYATWLVAYWFDSRRVRYWHALVEEQRDIFLDHVVAAALEKFSGRGDPTEQDFTKRLRHALWAHFEESARSSVRRLQDRHQPCPIQPPARWRWSACPDQTVGGVLQRSRSRRSGDARPRECQLARDRHNPHRRHSSGGLE